MRKLYQAMLLSVLCIFAAISTNFICAANVYERVVIESITEVESFDLVLDISQSSVGNLITTEVSDTGVQLTNEEIELIALVTMAEAEGECEEGKRLVIDTILNRVDSEYFPGTVYDVIYQPSQFSSMWNGRVERCEVRADICLLVEEELKDRTNYEVIFFTAGEYSAYGVPMFQVGNHYFSRYE